MFTREFTKLDSASEAIRVANYSLESDLIAGNRQMKCELNLLTDFQLLWNIESHALCAEVIADSLKNPLPGEERDTDKDPHRISSEPAGAFLRRRNRHLSFDWHGSSSIARRSQNRHITVVTAGNVLYPYYSREPSIMTYCNCLLPTNAKGSDRRGSLHQYCQSRK